MAWKELQKIAVKVDNSKNMIVLALFIIALTFSVRLGISALGFSVDRLSGILLGPFMVFSWAFYIFRIALSSFGRFGRRWPVAGYSFFEVINLHNGKIDPEHFMFNDARRNFYDKWLRKRKLSSNALEERIVYLFRGGYICRYIYFFFYYIQGLGFFYCRKLLGGFLGRELSHCLAIIFLVIMKNIASFFGHGLWVIGAYFQRFGISLAGNFLGLHLLRGLRIETRLGYHWYHQENLEDDEAEYTHQAGEKISTLRHFGFFSRFGQRVQLGELPLRVNIIAIMLLICSFLLLAVSSVLAISFIFSWRLGTYVQHHQFNLFRSLIHPVKKVENFGFFIAGLLFLSVYSVGLVLKYLPYTLIHFFFKLLRNLSSIRPLLLLAVFLWMFGEYNSTFFGFGIPFLKFIILDDLPNFNIFLIGTYITQPLMMADYGGPEMFDDGSFYYQFYHKYFHYDHFGEPVGITGYPIGPQFSQREPFEGIQGRSPVYIYVEDQQIHDRVRGFTGMLSSGHAYIWEGEKEYTIMSIGLRELGKNGDAWFIILRRTPFVGLQTYFFQHFYWFCRYNMIMTEHFFGWAYGVCSLSYRFCLIWTLFRHIVFYGPLRYALGLLGKFTTFSTALVNVIYGFQWVINNLFSLILLCIKEIINFSSKLISILGKYLGKTIGLMGNFLIYQIFKFISFILSEWSIWGLLSKYWGILETFYFSQGRGYLGYFSIIFEFVGRKNFGGDFCAFGNGGPLLKIYHGYILSEYLYTETWPNNMQLLPEDWGSLVWAWALTIYIKIQIILDSMALYNQFPRILDLDVFSVRLRRLTMFPIKKSGYIPFRGAYNTSNNGSIDPLIYFEASCLEDTGNMPIVEEADQFSCLTDQTLEFGIDVENVVGLGGSGDLARREFIYYGFDDAYRLFVGLAPIIYGVGLILCFLLFPGFRCLLSDGNIEDYGNRQYAWKRCRSLSYRELEKLIYVSEPTIFVQDRLRLSNDLVQKNKALDLFFAKMLNENFGTNTVSANDLRKLISFNTLGKRGDLDFCEELDNKRNYVSKLFLPFIFSDRYENLRRNLLSYGETFIILISYGYRKNFGIKQSGQYADSGDYVNGGEEHGRALAERCEKAGKKLRFLLENADKHYFHNNLGSGLGTKDSGSFEVQRSGDIDMINNFAFEVEDTDRDSSLPWAIFYGPFLVPLGLWASIYLQLENGIHSIPTVLGNGPLDVVHHNAGLSSVLTHFVSMHWISDFLGGELFPNIRRANNPLTLTSEAPTFGYTPDSSNSFREYYYETSYMEGYPFIFDIYYWKRQGFIQSTSLEETRLFGGFFWFLGLCLLSFTKGTSLFFGHISYIRPTQGYEQRQRMKKLLLWYGK